MPSFDIVSKVDMQEIDNAVNQALKEIEQRYDFKGTHNEINLEKDASFCSGADDYKLDAVVEVLKGKLVRRNVSPNASIMARRNRLPGARCASGSASFRGFPRTKARISSSSSRTAKLKVQAQIMEDQVRVTGKKIDDLQEVIQLLKGQDLGIELQFVNMRS
jgi:cyclic-di-GMP-binding protein